MEDEIPLQAKACGSFLSTRMKILVFVGYFFPHKGGSENHIYEFVEKLSKYYQISVITINTNNVKNYEVVNKNFDIYRISGTQILGGTFPIFYLNKSFFETIRILKENKYDLIMTRTRFFLTSFLGMIFAKNNYLPLIHVEHGSSHTVLKNKFTEFFGIIYDHIIGYLIVNSAKLNIGISSGACTFLQHLGAKNIVKINRGINYDEIHKIRRKLRKTDEVKRLIFVGRLVYAKGVQDLLVAFSRLERKNLKLMIVGGGSYKSALKNIVDKLEINKSVSFKGELDRIECLKLMSKSDIFINPSYSEGLPTSVLEAGALGMPVIATDVGGTKDIINPQTGILVSKKDICQLCNAINFMISNKKQRHKYQENITQFIKSNFDWDKIIRKWKKILR